MELMAGLEQKQSEVNAKREELARGEAMALGSWLAASSVGLRSESSKLWRNWEESVQVC